MTTAVLLVKALLDAAVAGSSFVKGDVPGGFLFVTFVLVDIASIGVLK
jgi:hypothetical protein